MTATLGTRAVVRRIGPGVAFQCEHCGDKIGFRARQTQHWVIANVYKRGRWERTAHYHDACYSEAGDPHGPAAE